MSFIFTRPFKDVAEINQALNPAFASCETVYVVTCGDGRSMSHMRVFLKIFYLFI